MKHINTKIFTIISLFFTLCSLILPSPIHASSSIYFGSIEKDLDTNEVKVYMGAGNATAVKVINGQKSVVNFLHSDHLGSTALVTDINGNKIAENIYYPYGNSTDSNQESGIRNQGIDKLYTGQRKDTSTDLYYYNARYYNPQTGRFVSADKAEGPNRYAYVGNNPVMKNDPSGNTVCAGEQCKHMFPFVYAAAEGFPEYPQPINNVGDALKSGVAHVLNVVGFAGFLPESYKNFVSKNDVTAAGMANMLPGPAGVSIASNLPGVARSVGPVSREVPVAARAILTRAQGSVSLQGIGEAWRAKDMVGLQAYVTEGLSHYGGGRLLHTSDELAQGIVNPGTIAEARNLGISIPSREAGNIARTYNGNIIMGNSLISDPARYAGELVHEYSAFYLERVLNVPRSSWNMTGSNMTSLNRILEEAVKSGNWEKMKELATTFAQNASKK
jgi:RHS repeat-associated protein